MDWLRSIMLPPQGSSYAGEVDNLYMFLVWLSVFFFLLVAGLALYSVWRYRYRPGRVTPHITHSLPLELIWSIVPLLLVVGIFFWGLNGYLRYIVAPGQALEIQVTAKKWLWQFEYPDGTRTINEIHVPVGKPVRLIMTSEDVIHDFYMPTMRIKHDIVPDRYTEVWFQPTQEGLHLATCAEYCGKGHSDMQAKVWVDSEAKYQDWIQNGGDEWKTMSPAAYGRLLWETKGCSTCHTLDGTRSQGPSWKGVYGHMVTMGDGKSYKADENYLRESILQPQAKIVEGFEGIMPTFQGMLREREISALIAFIKTLN